MFTLVIDAVIHYDPVEPRREFRLAFKFAGVTPYLDEYLLSQILDIILSPYVAVDGTEHCLLIFMNQLLESLLITAGHEFDYVLIIIVFAFDFSHDYCARKISLLFLT